MNKILNRLNVRNIQELYDLKEIYSSGKVELKSKNIIMYKIDPANIIDCDTETKFKIYRAYLACIRGLPDKFQILISKQKLRFNKQIEEYKIKLKKIDSEGLRKALKKYIEYLEEVENVNNIYKRSHYIVIEDRTLNDKNDLINVFSNLKEFGLVVEQIEKCEVEGILRNYLLKEDEE